MTSAAQISFGLDTFGDMQNDDAGQPISAAQTIRNVVAEAVLADELGLNNFNIGEHHRDDYAVSAPDTVLAGIATRTKNIIVGSGVTVLSSDDPIRVFQRFSTIDAMSNGRAEITAGRGSFTESFPLFGHDLGKYDVLFAEKLDLLLKALQEGPVTWSGSIRTPLTNQEIYPKTERGRIPIRLAVGGTPSSVQRAATLGIPLALAIIGGDPARFGPWAQYYRAALAELGKPTLPVSIHSPGHIADTDEEAIEDQWPHYAKAFGRIGRERGWGTLDKDHYLGEVHQGSLYVGSPETVARKIAYAIKAVGADRFDLKYATGPMPHSKLLKSIQLYATEVVPRVRELLAEQSLSA
jgi:probable LLM family oxidoreductase